MTNHELESKRSDLLMLPQTDRKIYVQKILIEYPRWKTIYDRFQRCFQENKYSSESKCFCLVGSAGAGKTTIAKSFASKYSQTITETSIITPVVYMSIPAPAKITRVARGLLTTLGDPRAFDGSLDDMNYRLVNFIRDCKVELIILDELQHLIDRDTERILRTVSDWLKSLVKETKVACVLVGLENEAEKVIVNNPQLLRLFGDPVVLHPFEWDERRPKTIDEYRNFLHKIEVLLPLKEQSNLTQRERSWRCYKASDGLVSYTMSLIRTATEFALDSNREHLDNDLLGAAFDYALAGRARQIDNPFHGCQWRNKIPQFWQDKNPQTKSSARRV